MQQQEQSSEAWKSYDKSQKGWVSDAATWWENQHKKEPEKTKVSLARAWKRSWADVKDEGDEHPIKLLEPVQPVDSEEELGVKNGGSKVETKVEVKDEDTGGISGCATEPGPVRLTQGGQTEANQRHGIKTRWYSEP